MISQLGSGGQVICFEDLHDDVTFHFFGFPKMPLMILGSVDDGGQPHCELENENLTIEWLEAEKYENPDGRALLERDPSFFSLGKACGKTMKITRRPCHASHNSLVQPRIAIHLILMQTPLLHCYQIQLEDKGLTNNCDSLS